jgi:hypothetical protein
MSDLAGEEGPGFGLFAPKATPAAVVESVRSGPGRPAGARNKLDLKLAAWLEARYGETPAQRLARIAYSDPVALAHALGCRPIEALGPVRQALSDLLPYTERKLAVELEPDDAGMIPILALAVPVQGAHGQAVELQPSNLKIAMKTKGEVLDAEPVGNGQSDAALNHEAKQG